LDTRALAPTAIEIQHEALKAAGCVKVYSEKLSGARADNRPQLDRMLKALRPGDMVVVTRLDRLARSTRDLLNILDQVTAAGASFKSLADAWCDTTTAHGKLLITILGGLAEFERSLILARTKTGTERARSNGVHSVVPPSSTRGNGNSLRSATRPARPWRRSPANLM
jgi:DNA invertase Pin-like site-specific DNA recombinase